MNNWKCCISEAAQAYKDEYQRALSSVAISFNFYVLVFV